MTLRYGNSWFSGATFVYDFKPPKFAGWELWMPLGGIFSAALPDFGHV